MSETTFNLIQAIKSGNALDTEAAFQAAMAEKIGAKLDDMRVSVAKSMFSSEQSDEGTFDAAEEESIEAVDDTVEAVEEVPEEEPTQE